jgi:hypothetical protein
MPPATAPRICHLTIDEGVIDSPSIQDYIFLRQDHPIVVVLQQSLIPRAAVQVQATLIPTLSAKDAAHRWYRVRRGIYYTTCSHLRAFYEFDEYVTTHYDSPPPRLSPVVRKARPVLPPRTKPASSRRASV